MRKIGKRFENFLREGEVPSPLPRLMTSLQYIRETAITTNSTIEFEWIKSIPMTTAHEHYLSTTANCTEFIPSFTASCWRAMTKVAFICSSIHLEARMKFNLLQG